MGTRWSKFSHHNSKIIKRLSIFTLETLYYNGWEISIHRGIIIRPNDTKIVQVMCGKNISGFFGLLTNMKEKISINCNDLS
jgi:hypothetical protein